MGHRLGYWLLAVAALLLLGSWLAWRQMASEVRPVVFLGDSLTARGDWEALLGPGRVANQGLDGEVSAGVLRRLPAILAQPPAKLFIMVGINDLHGAEPASRQVANLLDNYRRMMSLLQKDAPQTRTLFLSLLPAGRDLADCQRLNDVVREVNRRLAQLAAQAGMAYVDLHARMLDHDGQLQADCTLDGLHLSKAGYQLWLETIRPFL